MFKPVISFILILTCCPGAQTFWDPVPTHDATTPIIKDQWRIDEIDVEVQGADAVDVAFLGNSITFYWTEGGGPGQQVWDEYYAPLGAINLGINGDRTQGMLNRLAAGNTAFKPGVFPKVLVAMMGTNNIAWPGNDGPQTLEESNDGVRAVLQLLRRRLPYTRILLLGVFPRNGSGNNGLNDDVAAFNTLIMQHADGNVIQYLDITESFLMPNGRLNNQLFSDGLHPDADGYRVWAESIQDKLDVMLAQPPLQSIRILPLGNSVTEGLSSESSYRRYLDPMLRQAGHNIDFVGSQSKHFNNGQDPAHFDFDVDHEGHFSREADWVLERLDGYAQSARAHIAMIHLGTNDILHETGEMVDIVLRTRSELGQVIDKLRAVKPLVRIALAKLIPIKDTDIKKDGIAALNVQIEALAAEKSTENSPILVVDQFTEINVDADLSDNYHTNQAGAVKMADKWFEAVDSLINISPIIGVEKRVRQEAYKFKILRGDLFFKFHRPTSQARDWSLINLKGKISARFTIPEDNSEFHLDISSLSQGAYILMDNSSPGATSRLIPVLGD